ncbi:hypothetical protein DsansV1_C16g0140931 [Dioscorea sansibarensis]
MFITPTEDLNNLSDSKKPDILFQFSLRLLFLPGSSPNAQVIIRPNQHTGVGRNQTQFRLSIANIVSIKHPCSLFLTIVCRKLEERQRLQ